MKNKNIKIIVVGTGKYFFYSRALVEAFNEIEYVTASLFDTDMPKTKNVIKQLLYRIEEKYVIGKDIYHLNKSLIEVCKKNKPDLLFLYNCREIKVNTVKLIKKLNIFVVGYSNDNPFSDFFPKYYWRNYIKNIALNDLNYVYRESNKNDIRAITNKAPILLKSYYIKNKNFPVEEKDIIEGIPEVVFVGHYEADERIEYLEELLKRGIQVGVPRTNFEPYMKYACENLVFLENTINNYNRILCSCKIPIVFLSKLNNDTYTRRCFEIPAAGAMLLAPYTQDLASMYLENEEAVFYRSKEDFVDKIQYYLENDKERLQIARRGRMRLLKNKDEVLDRARQIVNDYEYYKKNN